MRRFRRFFTAVTAALTCAALCLTGCGQTGGEELPPDPAPEQSVLYGIAEPLFNSKVSGMNADIAADLMGALGVQSYRAWLEPDLFVNSLADCDTDAFTELNETLVQYYRSVFAKLRAQGIRQIVGHGILFPRVASTVGFQVYSVPVRDLSEGSEYLEFLDKTERVFETLARTFPEITVWEVANESNSNVFMHPAAYESDSSKGFTGEQSAAVITDFMYYASRGVKAGNPEAIAINPGWSPYLGPVEGMVDVKEFFELIYANIDSGQFPAGPHKSTDSRDYFQGLAWHPYYRHDSAPDEQWKQLNDGVFSVAQANGDGDLKVYFTEVGFSSGYGHSASCEEQAGWYEKLYEYVARMPYVDSVYIFRLFESRGDAAWGGEGEAKFGLFEEPVDGVSGFVPNAKAFALQKLYGGTGDLNRYADMK